MGESIFFNADVVTFDPDMPRAGLVLVKDGIIRAVSSRDRLKEFQNGQTALIDCRGRTLLPGFVDAHFHFHAFADRFLSLDVSPRAGVQCIGDIQSRIREQASSLPSGAWIRAKGYNEFYLREQRHPDRWDLDQADSLHPIKLTHRSGHAHVLNSLGLKRTGITRSTPDPPCGIIDRDLETAEPTGLLYEMGDYLSRRIPMPDARQFEAAVKKADQTLLSLGITSFQDASAQNGPDRWNEFDSWIQKGLIRAHVSMMIGQEAFDTFGLSWHAIPRASHRLQAGGVKIILDETTGNLYPDQKRLNEMVLKIHRAGRQAVVHAIEENAVESACLAIEDALKKFPMADHRHRIEHCSLCSPRLAERLASARIRVVTQPGFLYYNGDRYFKTVPRHQLCYLYPFNSLMEKGVALAAGSDCPIVPPDPFPGIYSAVTRRCETGSHVCKDEQISVKQVLKMMTIEAARACRQETVKGSISPGKMADMILIDRNPMTVALEELKDLKVVKTFINGEIVAP